VIRVARLSIAPVRSLALLHPEAIDLTEVGVLEDRRFFLVDSRGRLVDRTIAGPLVQVSSWTDPAATRLRLSLPGGRVIDGGVELGEPIEADVYGRNAEGHVVVGPWAAALEPYAGRPVRIVRCALPGGTRRKDGRVTNAVSLVSDGSLRRLAEQLGEATVDARRFRMLIEVEGAEPHQEDTWIGGRISIGSAELAVLKADARCAITTQDPDTGIRDLDTLRSIIAYRGLSPKRQALFGVLGEVATPGRVTVGDEVRVLD
jgi:uncharacterized protein YcbX